MYTKAVAENMVLNANCSSLVTCSLRPAHIYGGGDPMVSIIINMVRAGQVPFRMGDGTAINDYIYVSNCASAHLLAAAKLLRNSSGTTPSIAGKAYFVSDYHKPMWEHMRPLLEAMSLSPPESSIPFWFAYLLAMVVDFWVAAVYFCGGHKLRVDLSRYVVKATAQDYYFSCVLGLRELGDWRVKSEDEAIKETIDWLKMNPEGVTGFSQRLATP